MACDGGHVDVAKFLIDHKCDIECKDIYVNIDWY